MTKKFLTVSDQLFCSDYWELIAESGLNHCQFKTCYTLINRDRWIYQALTSCIDTSLVKSIASVLFKPVQYRKDISLILIFLHYSAESTSCVLFLPTIQHLAAEIFYEFKFSCNTTWKLSLVFKFSILPVNSTISAPLLRQVKRKLD